MTSFRTHVPPDTPRRQSLGDPIPRSSRLFLLRLLFDKCIPGGFPRPPAAGSCSKPDVAADVPVGRRRPCAPLSHDTSRRSDLDLATRLWTPRELPADPLTVQRAWLRAPFDPAARRAAIRTRPLPCTNPGARNKPAASTIPKQVESSNVLICPRSASAFSVQTSAFRILHSDLCIRVLASVSLADRCRPENPPCNGPRDSRTR